MPSLRRVLLPLVLLLGALASSATAAPRAARPASRGPVGSGSYDWDDNVVTMSTRTYLKSTKGGPELALSSAEWARSRQLVGKPGRLADYAVDPDPRSGSFRDAADHGGENLFLRDLKTSTLQNAAWRGPSWGAFVKSLSTPARARLTTIVTAREHGAATIHEGLRWLQREGLIRYVPPVENIFAVGGPGYAIDGAVVKGGTADRKVAVHRVLLDKLQQRTRGTKRVWAFSDDDWGNYSAALNGLAEGVRQGRWPDLELHLHFTGLHDATHAAQETILRAPVVAAN